MFVALLVLDLHVPAAGSLKAKRGVLKQLSARLRADLNVSVAEIGYQDLWQRCLLGVAIAAGSQVGARKVAQQVEGLVTRDPRVEILSLHVEVVAPELRA
ncbi:MAG: DUF503 domain-containing protein [Egibacteraceae bacterium]